MSYQLHHNWDANIRLLSAVKEEEHIDSAQNYLERLMVLARLGHVTIQVERGSFEESLERMPRSDISIFGLSQTANKEKMLHWRNVHPS